MTPTNHAIYGWIKSSALKIWDFVSLFDNNLELNCGQKMSLKSDTLKINGYQKTMTPSKLNIFSFYWIFSWFSLPPCLLNPSVTFCVNYFTYHGRIWKPIYWPAKAHVRALPLCQSVPHSMFIAKQNLGHFLLWSTASTSSSKAFVTFTPSNR